MKVTNEQISALVTSLISEKGISANELARRMGKSSGRMSEKLGSKPSWTFGELFALADALEMSPHDIVTDLIALASSHTR